MNSKATFRIVLTALFAALVCVATMFIRVPSPTSGYVNLGDGIVLLSAFMLGPVYGSFAAGIGSMLADILAGYPAYAVGTLIIKTVVALVGGAIYRRLHRKNETLVGHVVRIVISGFCAEIFMVLGYFAYSGIFLSYGIGAAVEIPGNIIQSLFGVVIASVLTPILMNSREIRRLLSVK